MGLEALIFDCDGTLSETEEAHREAFNRVFAENNLNWQWSQAVYGELLKITGGKERIRHFLRTQDPEGGARFKEDDDLVLAMHKRKTAIYMDLVRTGEVPLRPGVERLLREARASGMPMAIATTTNIEPLTALFEGTLGKDAINWFKAVAAGDMVPHKKPASDVYEMALEGLGLEGTQCLAFEDTTNGVVAARGADIPVLVTVSEYSEGQDFSGSLIILDNLGEADAPFTCFSDPAIQPGLVDLELAKAWHAGMAVST